MNQLCTHFGSCGGCKSQDISYEEELKRKQFFVEGLFPSHTVAPIMACEAPWEYRNKMEFSFSQAKSGERFLGLMMARGRVVNLSECLLCSPWFITALKRVKEWWEASGLDAYYPPKDRGHLRNLTLREGKRTGEKMAILTLSSHAIDRLHLATFVQALLEVVPLDSIVLSRQIIAKKQPTRFEEEILHGKDSIREVLFDADLRPLSFKIRPASFFQPNTLQAEKLIQKALSLACLKSEQRVFDLFCGTATIGIFASKHVNKVYGVEIVFSSIEDAKENLKVNNINNLELILGEVSVAIPMDKMPDVVIVDPPRVGLGAKTIELLKKLAPKTLLYISCNPITQAQDIAELKEYYRIRAIQPVDQFPRTPHIENIVALDHIF